MIRPARLLLGAVLPVLSPSTAPGYPADPAAEPPMPARLDSASASAARPASAGGTAAAIAGLESLPGGGWRVRLPASRASPETALEPALAELGRRLSEQAGGRVTVIAQASGPADLSSARRLSLARALAVKRSLVGGGLDATRIDLQPRGRTAEALDAVDIQSPPPGRAR